MDAVRRGDGQVGPQPQGRPVAVIVAALRRMPANNSVASWTTFRPSETPKRVLRAARGLGRGLPAWRGRDPPFRPPTGGGVLAGLISEFSAMLCLAFPSTRQRPHRNQCANREKARSTAPTTFTGCVRTYGDVPRESSLARLASRGWSARDAHPQPLGLAPWSFALESGASRCSCPGRPPQPEDRREDVRRPSSGGRRCRTGQHDLSRKRFRPPSPCARRAPRRRARAPLAGGGGVAGPYKPQKIEQPGPPPGGGDRAVQRGGYFFLLFGAPSSRGVDGRRPACSLASRSR